MNRDTSRRLYAEAQRFLAGGVSTIMRADAKPFPFYFDRGIGSHIFDVDGNEYLDYTLGFGPLIVGHCHPSVVEAVREQLYRGQTYGAQHRLEPLVAEQIHTCVPCAEMVVCCNTETEAVQVALRITRAATQRRRFGKFEGHYHGWLDNVPVSYRATEDQMGSRIAARSVPNTSGQSTDSLKESIVLPWNDLDVVEDTFSRHGFDIAALITEPVMFNTGGIEPKPGYLRGLHE